MTMLLEAAELTVGKSPGDCFDFFVPRTACPVPGFCVFVCARDDEDGRALARICSSSRVAGVAVRLTSWYAIGCALE